jgi:homoserine O-acetyltransferase
MRLSCWVALVAVAAVGSAGASAQGYGDPTHEHDYVVRDVHFADGESLPEVRMHYRTFGTPRGDNVVLILHSTGGASPQYLGPIFAGQLFGPGQLLDSSRYFLILPDDIGHGKSGKPSDGMHARFPKYGYSDMVDLEHRLVSEGLHIDHLRLVLGASMGCMHAWMWGERYPTMMDGLVPLACAPTQIAGRNRLWRKMAIDDIRDDPAWHGGDYTSEPPGLAAALRLELVVSSNPVQYQKTAPTRDAADSLATTWVARLVAGSDANDLLYQIDASRDYDPSRQLELIVAPVLAINTADDAINPPEIGLMERLIPRVKHARYVLIPLSEQTNGHGTHTMAAVWKSYLADFLASLPLTRLPATGT